MPFTTGARHDAGSYMLFGMFWRNDVVSDYSQFTQAACFTDEVEGFLLLYLA